MKSAESRPRRLLRFGSFELDEARLELRRDGERIRVQAKPLALLLYLTRHPERVISHEELVREVWEGIHVEAGALKSAVHSLRRALESGGDEADRWITSVHGQGYRFAGKLEEQSAGPAGATASGPAQDFVDREAEMLRLRSLREAALRGERQIVLLTGPPGVGKTRTASELARESEWLCFETHIGRTHESAGAPPLWPWAQILRSWIHAHGAETLEKLVDGGRASDLLGLAPEPSGHATSTYVPADQARFRLLQRVCLFLERASRQQPLLLVIDDAHRADSASLELLLFLAQHVSRARLMVVVTHRPVESGHSLGRLLHEPATESLSLAGLARASIESILERRLGRKPEPELTARIYDASGGNPLFVSELVRGLPADGSARSAPRPPRVHDAVWARICECSRDCQELLRLAAVAGPELTLPLLRCALPELGTTLLDVLREAEQRDLVTSTHGVCRFVHGVVREALYEKLAPVERMELHRRIGDALERLHASEPSLHLSELAHHFVECAALERAERAVHYARRAADVARAVCAFSEARELYEGALRALACLEHADPELRGSLLIDLGDVLGYQGAPIAAFQTVFVDAMDWARQTGRVHMLARAAERCSMHMDGRGCFLPWWSSVEESLVPQLRSTLEQVKDTDEVRRDPVLRARVHLALANAMMLENQTDAWQLILNQALELARVTGDPYLHGDLLLRRYFVVFDDLEQRRALPNELLRWTLETQNLRLEVEARSIQLYGALERGDRAAFDQIGAEYRRIARDAGLPTAVYLYAVWESLRSQLEGPLDATIAQTQNLLRTAARLNLSGRFMQFVLGTHTWWLGQLSGRSEQLVPPAELLLPAQPFPEEARISLARLYLECDRIEDARRTFTALPPRRTLVASGEVWIFSAVNAAELCARLEDREKGTVLIEQLLPYAERCVYFLSLCTGPISRYVASLAAMLGRWPQAESLFEQAATHAKALRAPLLRALVDVDHALAFRAHPSAAERRRNEKRLESAKRAARELGLVGPLARLERATQA